MATGAANCCSSKRVQVLWGYQRARSDFKLADLCRIGGKVADGASAVRFSSTARRQRLRLRTDQAGDDIRGKGCNRVRRLGKTRVPR